MQKSKVKFSNQIESNEIYLFQSEKCGLTTNLHGNKFHIYIKQIITEYIVQVADLSADRIAFEILQNIEQLLDEVEQNIVICQWRADQLFASAFGFGK